MLIEYKVRPITRYIVTRYEQGDVNEHGNCAAACSGHGEFDNERVAEEVAYALCKQEHDHLGWPVGDERIRYPRRSHEASNQLLEPTEAIAL